MSPGGDAGGVDGGLDLEGGAPIAGGAERSAEPSRLGPPDGEPVLAQAGDVDAGELQVRFGVVPSKTHHAVRPAAEERGLERQVRPAVEPALVHEVGVDAVDRASSRCLSWPPSIFASRDIASPVPLSRPAAVTRPLTSASTPSALEVAQVDARLQAKVGIEGADPPQGAGDLHVRVEDVRLQRLDRDVEARGDAEAPADGPQRDRGVALPGSALGRDVERSLADGAAHGDAGQGELILRAQVVDDRSRS